MNNTVLLNHLQTPGPQAHLKAIKLKMSRSLSLMHPREQLKAVDSILRSHSGPFAENCWVLKARSLCAAFDQLRSEPLMKQLFDGLRQKVPDVCHNYFVIS